MSATRISEQARGEAAALFNQGVRAIHEGRDDEAGQSWAKALKMDPTLVPAGRNLVVYHEQRGNYAEVAETYAIMLREDPFDTDSLIRQAAAFAHLGRYDDARNNYRRAISIYPYFRFWYAELADVVEKLGDHEDAALWRERGEKLDADEAEMAFEDGLRSLKTDNYALAIACFGAIVEEYPANLDARLRLATAHAKNGDDSAAFEQYERAVELTDAAQALVHFHRAELHMKNGDQDKAKADLQFALDHEEEYGRAARLLDRLGGTPSGASDTQPPPNQATDETTKPLPEPPPPRPNNGAPPVPPPSARKSGGRFGTGRNFSFQRGATPAPVGSSGTEPAQAGLNPSAMRNAGISESPRMSVPATSSRPGTQKLRPVEAEPSVLDVSMMEIESDEDDHHNPPASPDLPPLPRNVSWEQQIEHVFQHALSVALSSGAQPRVALIYEPSRDLVPAASQLLRTIQHPAFQLWRPGQPGRVFIAEANPDATSASDGLNQAGWLGHQDGPRFDFNTWGSNPTALQLDGLLGATASAAGDDGFNLVVVLSAGRVAGTPQQTAELVRRTNSHQFVLLRPQYHYADLGLRMQGVAPNWAEIALPF